MKANFVTVVFDRKKTLARTGEGAVEFYVSFSRAERKYMTYRRCSAPEWKRIEHGSDLLHELAMYRDVAKSMYEHHEELTISNFLAHLGIEPTPKRNDSRIRLLKSPTGFIEFMLEEVQKEKMKDTTRKRMQVVFDAIARYGRLNRFSDLNDRNVKMFDEFLRREDSGRTDQTLYNYHKVIKKYARLAYQYDFIQKNPYESGLCKFKRGESEERRPLSEDELIRMRELDHLTLPEEHARDLFIFSAYTGLAFSDNQNFDFETMTEQVGDTHYIDGQRMKTGHNFFTPILPPAMEMLRKYNFMLPRMSNQKMNMYLHLVETRLGLHKPLTSHVARHSFATLTLAHDIPIENVARMLGHTNTNTTRIYAKVLKTTIERHTLNLVASLK